MPFYSEDDVFRLMDRPESLVNWKETEPASLVWLVDWKKFRLPYHTVYVIAPDGLWPSKIGISNFAKKRVYTLQTSHWKPLKVAHCFWCKSQKDAYAVEQRAHDILDDEGVWLLGEWFDKPAKKAGEIVRFAANVAGVEIWDRIEDADALAEMAALVKTERGNYELIDNKKGPIGRLRYTVETGGRMYVEPNVLPRKL